MPKTFLARGDACYVSQYSYVCVAPASDAFVAKVNSSGTGLVYAGYIGGTGYEKGNGIAVGSTGEAYVTGLIITSDATFPSRVDQV